MDDAPGEPEPADGRAGGRGAVFDWWFRDRTTGAITIVQLPNIPLWIFLAGVVLRRVVPEGTPAATAVAWISTVALGWWALDELLRGVNPWRRLLGIGGCVAAVVGVTTLLR